MEKDGGKLVTFTVEGGKKKEMMFDREVCIYGHEC